MTSATVEALIVRSNMISFSQGVTAADQRDIADLLLYADFFATQSYRKAENWTTWLNYYRSQLIATGCSLKSTIVKEPVFITDAQDLDKLGFAVTGSVRVANLMALMQRSFKAARLSEFSRHFFQYGAGSGGLNSFQVVPCEAIAGTDQIHILLCGLHASARADSESRGGDWRIKREMVVRLGGGVYAFDRSAYALHRERIRARLNAVGRFNIQQISI